MPTAAHDPHMGTNECRLDRPEKRVRDIVTAKAVREAKRVVAAALMKPVGEDVLLKWPVSKRVNGSRAPDDDASLIESIEKARATV
jgi:hypothetical protein